MTDSPSDGGSRIEWYLREVGGNTGPHLWQFVEDTAIRVDVTNAEAGAGTYFKAEPAETVWDCIRRTTNWLDEPITEGRFIKMELGPGEYYPRMARQLPRMTRQELWYPDLAREHTISQVLRTS